MKDSEKSSSQTTTSLTEIFQSELGISRDLISRQSSDFQSVLSSIQQGFSEQITSIQESNKTVVASMQQALTRALTESNHLMTRVLAPPQDSTEQPSTSSSATDSMS